MVKIGILTFFSSINNGAFLQAYSLQEFIKNRYLESAEVQVINYTSPECIQVYEFVGKQKIENYHKSWERLSLTDNELITNDIDEISAYIAGCKFDIIIVGSDEVWKTDGYRGFPNAYWLNYDVGNAIRVSYAVSGRSDYQTLSLTDRKYIVDALRKFEYVGVRDNITRTEICKLENIDVCLNCDPTILFRNKLRFSEKQKSVFRKKWKTDGRKLILIMVSDSFLSKQLYRMLRNEFDVYDINEKGEATDRNVFDISPFEWSELISVADFVITSLFHGTVFSLIHDIPFIAIELDCNGRGKVENILADINLLECMFRLSDYLGFQIKMGMEIYTQCRNRLRCLDKVSYESLLDKEADKSETFFEFLDSCT